uniref:X-ray radiation resistance associated 1 n=1 Tax=Myripristis murdjan TaxID=586833 RepID=A0A667X275_9TELE
MQRGLSKLVFGQSRSAQRLRPRAILRRRGAGPNLWLVVRGKAVDLNQRPNLPTRKKENRKLDSRSNESENKAKTDGGVSVTPRGNTLDGPLLMRLHCVDEPSELCVVNISEQRLDSVEPDDLKEFDSVAYINAFVNSLSLGSFSSFCSLIELDLSLNGIRNMAFDAADFPHLEVLDLSYNHLSADDVASLGRLPRLKVLDLSANELQQLPSNLGSSNSDLTQLPTKKEDAPFRALEVLMLDGNNLASGVFSSLANLRRLRYLNLQGNRISEIPDLVWRDRMKRLQTPNTRQNKGQGLDNMESNPTNENFKGTSELVGYVSHMLDGSGLPLPELQFLNLAANKIAEEEALLAVGLFPKLSEIVIHSNPLTTLRCGGLPLLMLCLQERLGITVKHKKTQDDLKPSLRVCNDPTWKVKERIPKMPRNTPLMEARPRSLLSSLGEKQDASNHFSQTKIEEGVRTVMRRSKAKNSETCQNAELFFLTQATDEQTTDKNYEPGLPSDEKEKAKNLERTEDDAIPEQFEGYRMLMDAEPNPDVVVPIGIQTATRMLEHTMRNLIVFREPYRERHRKVCCFFCFVLFFFFKLLRFTLLWSNYI